MLKLNKDVFTILILIDGYITMIHNMYTYTKDIYIIFVPMFV